MFRLQPSPKTVRIRRLEHPTITDLRDRALLLTGGRRI